MSTNLLNIFRYVIYYRVSTDKQKESGLGLEAQRAMYEAHCRRNECITVAEFIEIEHSDNRNRPELKKALHRAKFANAILVIAKLDRLARDVGFLDSVIKSGVHLLALDMPGADEITMKIMMVLAEAELNRIRTRTRDAMAVLKAKNVKLGAAREGYWEKRGLESKEKWRKRGPPESARRRIERAQEAYEIYLPDIRQQRTAGKTLGEIAAWLNEAGAPNSKGEPFTDQLVSQIIRRYIPEIVVTRPKRSKCQAMLA